MEVGESGVVARRYHLHRRIIQDACEANLPQGRGVEGPGWSLQLEPRGKRASRDRHSSWRHRRHVRLQGARSAGGRAERVRRVDGREEESEVIRTVDGPPSHSLDKGAAPPYDSHNLAKG